jgi:hypothetical protein
LLHNKIGTVLQLGTKITHDLVSRSSQLCGSSESLSREFSGCSMGCGHAVELPGKINPEQQGAGAEAVSWPDEQGPMRTIDLYRMGASPRACRL